MKKILVFSPVIALFSLVQSAFSLNPSLEGGRVIALKSVSEEIREGNTSVQKFFQSLDGDEQRLFNAILQSNYSAGYYLELLRSSDAVCYAKLNKVLGQVEEHLRTLKDGGAYDAILARAGPDVVQFMIGRREVGMLRGYIIGQRKWVLATHSDLAVQLSIDPGNYWGALFFGEMYTPSVQGTQYPLKAEEVFPLSAHEMVLKPTSLSQSKKSRRFDFDLSGVDVGKALFVSLLSLLAGGVIVLVVGAYSFSHVSLFRRVRLLLEY